MRWDNKGVFKFASLQSDYAKDVLSDSHIDPKALESIVYYHNGKIKQKSNAALTVALKLGLPYSLLYVFKIVPRFLRNYVYDVIARNRYAWFGKRDACMVPTEDEKELFLEMS